MALDGKKSVRSQSVLALLDAFELQLISRDLQGHAISHTSETLGGPDPSVAPFG